MKGAQEKALKYNVKAFVQVEDSRLQKTFAQDKP